MADHAPATRKAFTATDWTILTLVATCAFLAVLHMIFGLRSVLDVLIHPATAAWVQAIGAIAAIAIAIWVANSTERSARENARVTAKHFLRMAEAAIGGLHVVCGIYSEESDVQKVRFLAELKEVHHIGQGISIALLQPQLCDLVLQARTLVARSHDLGVDIRHRPPPRFDAPRFPQNRDGFSIGNALLEGSWNDMKAINEKASML